MKVAIVDPSLFTWPYDSGLCEGLIRHGAEATVIGRRLARNDQQLPHPLLRQHYYPALAYPAARRLPRPLFLAAKGVSHFFSTARLIRELRAIRPDVIHFQWLPLPLLDLVFLSRLREIAPLVLTVHDTVPFNGSPRSRLQALGFARALGRFEALIVHTEQGRRRVADLVGAPERIHVLPHGLPPLDEVNAVGAAEDALEFLMFGKIKPYKGVDILIRAVAQLRDVLPRKTRFRIVGEPFIDMAPLRQEASDLGVDSFFSFELDYVADADMVAMFNSASALLFPYREIEASGVLMNALEYGRPVIASHIGAFAEYLNDGEDGLLVEPENPNALAKAIARFVSEPALRRQLTDGICARRRQLPSWDDVAGRTLSMYADIRARRSATSAPIAAAGCAIPVTPKP